MEIDKEFIEEHGKAMKMTLRNSRLTTDNLQRRMKQMRKFLRNYNEYTTRIDVIERRFKKFIEETGKEHFTEEEIEIMMRQALGLDIREYDKSHLVNLELDEVKRVNAIPEKESKTYIFGSTRITQVGTLTYTDWMGMEDLLGLPYYKVERENQNGEVSAYKVFSHINIEKMETDTDYRAAVIDTLLDESNMTKTNCGGYIGSIEKVEEGRELQDTVRANSNYSLVFDSTDATAVVKLRNIVKDMQEKETREKHKGERE